MINKPKITTLKPRIATIDTRQGSSVAVERIVGRHLGRIRERIALRAGYQCEICGRVTVHGVVDHKVPLFQGGAESDENRQWLCHVCHGKKSQAEEKQRDGVGQISTEPERR
jgi:5-methylcytosine-specific restriction protein A